MHTENRRRHIRKKTLFIFALAVFLTGYGLLGVSLFGISQSSPSVKNIAVSGVPNKTQLTIDLPEKGTYYLNSTSEVQTNESSMIEVFDSKERLVFGMPVFSLPTEFDIDSAGIYSISLENVTMQGARLVVLEDVQSVTVFAPSSYYSIPSKVMLVLGAVFSSAVFLFYLATRSEEQKDRSRRFREIVEVSDFLRPFCIIVSLFFGPLAVYVLLTQVFGSLPSFYAAVSIGVAFLIIAVYWLEFYNIVGLILSDLGYGFLLLMKRILNYLLISVLIMYVFVFTGSISMAPMWVYDATMISVIFVIPLLALFTLLAPFIDPLNTIA